MQIETNLAIISTFCSMLQTQGSPNRAKFANFKPVSISYTWENNLVFDLRFKQKI